MIFFFLVIAQLNSLSLGPSDFLLSFVVSDPFAALPDFSELV